MNIAFWLYSLQKFTWFWQRQAKIWFYFFFSLAWSRIVHFTKEYPPPLFTAFTAVSVAELPLLAFCRRRRDKFVSKCTAEYFSVRWTHTTREYSSTHRVDRRGSEVHSLTLVEANCPRKCDNTLVREAVAHVLTNTHAPNQSISCRTFHSSVYTEFQYTRLRDSCAIDVIPQLFPIFLLIHIVSYIALPFWECYNVDTHKKNQHIHGKRDTFPASYITNDSKYCIFPLFHIYCGIQVAFFFFLYSGDTRLFYLNNVNQLEAIMKMLCPFCPVHVPFLPSFVYFPIPSYVFRIIHIQLNLVFKHNFKWPSPYYVTFIHYIILW